jgi:flavodoxin
MKTLIIYSSVHHGNTAKLAEAIAAKLGADLVEAGKAWPDRLAGYDLIGFGSGIYFGTFDKKLIALVDALHEQEGRKAFVFSTSGSGKTSYNDSFVVKLRDKGFSVIGNFSCKGFDTWGAFKIAGGLNKGKPDETDLRDAAKFAEELKRSDKATE